ncbi:extracellular solute-binding protein [Devosia rhodophyticola]
MTWSHPRGYDPMVATARQWHADRGVEIVWDQRSLQDFESFPVEELARQYDLIVIDHPHVGQITAENCLAPLDVTGREAELQAMRANSVGQSFDSYNWAGRQWAFPIDAAAQVQAFRPDKLPQPLTEWDQVIDLAQKGQIILPMRAPHSLMCLYTLAANLGHSCSTTDTAELLDVQTGIQIITLLRAVTDHINADQFEMDPIGASEAMAMSDSPFAVMPLGYGYLSYGLADFRPKRLKFADIPAVGEHGPVGSALGGTGIAVSAFSSRKPEAIDYAHWVASAPVQRGLYAQSGGQPGHGLAWEDDDVNSAVDDFYRNTRATLENAWVRPRHNGYMAFQDAAARRLNAGLLSREEPVAIIEALNQLFRKSF